MSEKKYKYSEIFGNTIQGEGKYTGISTVWIRFWGCNLNCNGFFQDNPTDPTTYKLEYQTIDVSSIKRIEDLPVFKTGCDSSYSWSKKFAHLAHTNTVHNICDELEKWLTSPSNPSGKFQHETSKQWSHLAFTGGEPMMNQNAIVDILEEFDRRGNMPKYITIETNGTQVARDKFTNYCSKLTARGIELFWSVSPKLYLSGEKKEDTLHPSVLAKYFDISQAGQLKYVSNGSDRSWNEVIEFTNEYRKVNIPWDVWIMPVGADIDGQNKMAAKVSEGAVSRGYNVSARVHTYLFGNVIGK